MLEPDGDIYPEKKALLYDTNQLLNGGCFLYNQIASHVSLNAGDKILDVGCGTGTVLRKVRKRHLDKKLDLYGIDPSPAMIAVAKRKTKNQAIDLRVGYGQKLEFEDNMFDVVISTLTTHHVPTTVRPLMFGEIFRVLKPGGKLYLSDLHLPETHIGKALFSVFLKNHAYTQDLVDQPNATLLKKQGFKLLEVTTQKPLSLIEHILAFKA